MNKHKIFESELNTITNEDIKNYAIELLNKAPDYFYSVSASSTGKYHPQYALGDGGLVRHTKALVRIANHLLNLEQYDFFTDREKDLIRVAGMIHDSWKHGDKGSSFTTHTHPVVAAKFAIEASIIIKDEERQFVSNAVASHMGQWNTTKKDSTILPKPETEAQKLVHMCDYLASRKDIEIIFDESNVGISQKKEEIKIETWTFPFGKHKGELILDVVKSDSDYIRWAKENMQKEPVKSILAMV